MNYLIEGIIIVLGTALYSILGLLTHTVTFPILIMWSLFNIPILMYLKDRVYPITCLYTTMVVSIALKYWLIFDVYIQNASEVVFWNITVVTDITMLLLYLCFLAVYCMANFEGYLKTKKNIADISLHTKRSYENAYSVSYFIMLVSSVVYANAAMRAGYDTLDSMIVKVLVIQLISTFVITVTFKTVYNNLLRDTINRIKDEQNEKCSKQESK